MQGQACKRAIQQRTVMLGNWLMGGEAMGMESMDIRMLENIRKKVGFNSDKVLALRRVVQRVFRHQ